MIVTLLSMKAGFFIDMSGGKSMHKMIMAVIVVAIMAMCSLPLYAEIYQGIGPLDTLGDEKAKFPNAKYVKTKLAWAKETDAIYEVTGQGIYGLMMINFQDLRPLYRQTAVDDPDKKDIFFNVLFFA